MKKVLHLLMTDRYSGAENVVCTIIDNLKKNYEFAYCSPNGPIKKVLKNKKILYYPLTKKSISQIKKVIKDYNPDVIHAHDYTASVLAAFSGFKGKIISHLHINANFAKKWNLKTLVYKLALSKIDRVIGVSNAVYEQAIFKRYIENKYETIYNFVDKDGIIVKSDDYSFDKKYDLFFFGRLTNLKDPIKFIEIVNKICKMNDQIKAVMIGDGDLKDQCIEMINYYKLENNIDLLGFIDNPFPIIKNSKVGIMPSKVEGFGLTAIEALILGKPILNSGVGGLKEIFKNNSFLICDGVEEYCNRFFSIINGTYKISFSNELSAFCDKLEWENKLKNLYM